MASKMVTRCNCPEVAEGSVLDWVGGATHIDTGQSLSLLVHHCHCWSVITRSVIVVISQLIVGWSSLSELCLSVSDVMKKDGELIPIKPTR